MGTPFMSEIRIMSFNWPPRGWAQCNGQLLPINQNQALFALLGTNYGGDGRVNFALPDFRGRVPMHVGGGFALAQKGGAETVTVTIQQLPTHAHVANGANDVANSPTPAGTLLAQTSNSTFGAAYASGNGNLAAMASGVVSNVGGSQPHPNMAPYLTLNFCIALQGYFPTQA